METVIAKEVAKANFAANLRRLLDRDGMSISELARRTGENTMTVSESCRGVRMSAADVVARFAEVFDVSIDRLLAEPPKNLSVAS